MKDEFLRPVLLMSETSKEFTIGGLFFDGVALVVLAVVGFVVALLLLGTGKFKSV